MKIAFRQNGFLTYSSKLLETKSKIYYDVLQRMPGSWKKKSVFEKQIIFLQYYNQRAKNFTIHNLHKRFNYLAITPFTSSHVPLFQNESKCETFHMEMSCACSFIFTQIIVIFIRMVSHLDSLWNWGTREFRNGILISNMLTFPRKFVR